MLAEVDATVESCAIRPRDDPSPSCGLARTNLLLDDVEAVLLS